MGTYSRTLTCIRHLMFAAALCFQADVSRAALDTGIVYNFNSAFPGDISPAGSAPWVTANFQNDGSAGVLLTISGTYLGGSEKLDKIYFNMNPVLSTSIPNLTFSLQSTSDGLAQPQISKGEDAFKADGDGYYDLEFAFETGQGAFSNGDSITYLISGVTSLTADDFAYQSTPAGGVGPYYAAAHILGISPINSSTWVDPSGGPIPQTSMMPEPVAFGFAAAALAGIVALCRRKSV